MRTPIYLLFLFFISQSLCAQVLYQQNFDNLDEWQSLGRSTLGPLPGDFNGGTTAETWHPSEIPNSMPSIFISGQDLNKVFGNTGKSLVVTYESIGGLTPSGSWPSDGFLIKDFSASNEVYVRFKMKFQDNFFSNADENGGTIKLFRIASYDGAPGTKTFGKQGVHAPIYFFDWGGHLTYGASHKHSFRCDDQGTNYYCANPAILDAPRTINRGDMTGNFTSNVAPLGAKIPDLVNGGFLPSEGSVDHAQVYGNIWHTYEYYVKLNSSPGVADGQFKFWLDGQPLVDMRQIPWISQNGSMNAKWNRVIFGGNGTFDFNTNTSDPVTARERWVAIDEILVLDRLPNNPNAPSNVRAIQQ